MTQRGNTRWGGRRPSPTYASCRSRVEASFRILAGSPGSRPIGGCLRRGGWIERGGQENEAKDSRARCWVRRVGAVYALVSIVRRFRRHHFDRQERSLHVRFLEAGRDVRPRNGSITAALL